MFQAAGDIFEKILGEAGGGGNDDGNGSGSGGAGGGGWGGGVSAKYF